MSIMGAGKTAGLMLLMCVYLSAHAGVIEQAAAQSQGSRLTQGSVLDMGQSLDAAHYQLLMQPDCNLVLYGRDSSPLWSSGTADSLASCFLTVDVDGSARIYGFFIGATAPYPAWDNGTSNRNDGDHVLVLQEDGNLVMYNASGQAIWATNTSGRQ